MTEDDLRRIASLNYHGDAWDGWKADVTALIAEVRRLQPYEQLADELVGVIGRLEYTHTELCIGWDSENRCDCGVADVLSLIAKHAKMKGKT